MDTLKANSIEYGIDEKEELKRLLIHGILHLNGMEHNAVTADDPMIKLQEEILKDFGDFLF